MNDVAVAIMACMGWLFVAGMFLSTAHRMYAKLWARKIKASDKSNLKLVVWNEVKDVTETLMMFTEIPMAQHNAIIRAVRMWGIVRRKAIIEITLTEKKETIYRTY